MKKQRILTVAWIFLVAMIILNASEIYAQPQKMDISQTLSDNAQKFTIAFSGLAFLSGEEESYTFLPPGKLSDYFGFQFLRDNDPDQMGHNTDFVTKSANNMLAILNENQKAAIIALAKSQVSLINQYGYTRFPLIRAFRRLLTGDMPVGATGLDSSEVMKYSAGLFRIDGIISYQRAKLFGSIIRSLTKEQRDSLDKLASVGMLHWPYLEDQIDKTKLTHDEHVAAMTYASEMFGWYAGSVEADVYFCPERQATYFGGFYMKDIPAMGNPNYSIDPNITADKGKAFLEALKPAQAELVSGIVALQKPTLYAIVDKREEISNALRGFRTNDNIDSLEVIRLSEEYGELDGLLAYWYASRFAGTGWTLTQEQKDSLMALRDLEDYPAEKPFLFSEKIDWPKVMNTDFLFNSPDGVETQGTTAGRPEVTPNPFSGNSSVSFNTTEPGNVKIYTFDVFGRELVSTTYYVPAAGRQRIDFDGSRLAPGMYILTIETSHTVMSSDFIIIR